MCALYLFNIYYWCWCIGGEIGVLFELEHYGESLDLVKHMHIDPLSMITHQYLHISKVDPQH